MSESTSVRVSIPAVPHAAPASPEPAEADPPAPTYVIISRHAAAVEFCRVYLATLGHAQVEALSSATADDVRGKVVVGNLPLHLASLAAEVWAVEFGGEPPRGTEYSADEMRAAGARIVRYAVRAVEGGPQ